MQSFGTPFGAFGTAVYGRDAVANVGDCPVPTGIMGIFFTVEEHDGYCNCVYQNEPVLAALCRIKIGDKLPNDDTYLDPSMPWTVVGKRTRGLLNDALGKLLQGLLHKATEGVMNAGEEIGVLPHTAAAPATTGGPVGASVTVKVPVMMLQTQQSADRDNSLFPTLENTGSNQLLVAGGVAFGVWWFLLRDEPRAVSGFGGYRRRRRSRR